MAVEVFPLIAQEQYFAFRQLLGEEIPATYDEWRSLQNKEKIDSILSGHPAREVPIYPREFAQYVNTSRIRASLSALRAFTVEIDALSDGQARKVFDS
jgi:hypothetical protein